MLVLSKKEAAVMVLARMLSIMADYGTTEKNFYNASFKNRDNLSANLIVENKETSNET